GGQHVKYTVMVVCGNYHGVIGFAKAKGEAIPSASEKPVESVYDPYTHFLPSVLARSFVDVLLLSGFECVKAMTLMVEGFIMENGLLTRTFKAATILQTSSAIRHISNIDNMYIKSYSFSLFSSLPGVLTSVRGESLKNFRCKITYNGNENG
ncbi:ribosomal protein S5, partial [Tanacetum coccineum]